MYEMKLADGTVVVVAASTENEANELFMQNVGIASHGEVISCKQVPSGVYCVIEKV